jgi:hypothetical protein
LKMTSKMHSTVKRTPKTHIQNASVIDPLGRFWQIFDEFVLLFFK